MVRMKLRGSDGQRKRGGKVRTRNAGRAAMLAEFID